MCSPQLVTTAPQADYYLRCDGVDNPRCAGFRIAKLDGQSLLAGGLVLQQADRVLLGMLQSAKQFDGRGQYRLIGRFIIRPEATIRLF